MSCCLCWFKSIGATMSLALTKITRFTRYSIGNNVWKQATELAKRVAVEATARDPAYQCVSGDSDLQVLMKSFDEIRYLILHHYIPSRGYTFKIQRNPRDDSPVLLTSFTLPSMLQDLLSGFLVQVGTQVKAGKGASTKHILDIEMI